MRRWPSSYARDVTDEFVLPTVILDNQGNPRGRVRPGDVVIFYNFRADRAREITRAFVDRDFSGFERPGGYPDVDYVCMTQYDATIQAPVAFPPQSLKHTLGEVLAAQGAEATANRRDREVCPRHLLLQWRGGDPEPRRRPDPDPLAESGHL